MDGAPNGARADIRCAKMSFFEGFIGLKSLGFPANVSSGRADETNLRRYETIFRFWRRYAETSRVYLVDNQTAVTAATETGDSQMRTVSFILAFAFILAGPSIAGSSGSDLPGVGTFSYSGSPVTNSAHQPVVVAAN